MKEKGYQEKYPHLVAVFDSEGSGVEGVGEMLETGVDEGSNSTQVQS